MGGLSVELPELEVEPLIADKSINSIIMGERKKARRMEYFYTEEIGLEVIPQVEAKITPEYPSPQNMTFY